MYECTCICFGLGNAAWYRCRETKLKVFRKIWRFTKFYFQDFVTKYDGDYSQDHVNEGSQVKVGSIEGLKIIIKVPL